MSRGTWDNIKHSKRFYITTYRVVGTALTASCLLSLLLILMLYYVYFHRAEPDFYATSGVTPPIKLAPLLQPNNAATPLLPNEPEGEVGEKVIPQ